jgi:hypothetical protein
MADCIRSTRQREVTTVVEEEVLTLTLSREEARVLKTLLMRVTGSMTKSPRGLCDRMERALSRAGVSSSSVIEPGALASGNLRFRDYTYASSFLTTES